MPPYQEDYEHTMMIATPAPAAGLTQSPSSHPNLLELPKDAAFLNLMHEQQDMSSSGSDTSHDASTSSEDSVAVLLDRLEFSLNRATERATEIKARLDLEDTDTTNHTTAATGFQAAKTPLIFGACRTALLAEMTRKLKLATLLLEDAKRVEPSNEDGAVPVTQMTKNKRLSSALISALQYLDTLESAMNYSSRERLESKLRSVANSIAGVDTQLDNSAPPAVCVSSWRAPSLAFDFRVGSTAVQSVVGASSESSSALPMDLEVKPIMEYTADELLVQNHHDAPLKSPRDAGFYTVSVKKCRHEERKSVPREGIVGQAMVQVHIAPAVAETKSMKKKESVWGMDTKDVIPMRIKEVRATQQNACSTKFRINFDMYTSFTYGEKGVTLTLNLETCETIDGQVPKVLIELVVAP